MRKTLPITSFLLPSINDVLLCEHNIRRISSSRTLTKTHNKQLQDAMKLPASFSSNRCIFPSSFSQIAVAAEVHIFTVLQTKSNTHTDSVNYGLNKNTSERENVSGTSAKEKKSKSLFYIIQI